MFEVLEIAPADPILGLGEAFRNDSRPEKINLGVGVFKDETGETPTLKAVRAAEKALFEKDTGKSYLGIHGLPEYGPLVQELLFGSTHEIVTENRAATLQTPGGTGALRVAADLLVRKFPGVSIWCSSPTWANHHKVFEGAGLEVHSYRYLDSSKTKLDFDSMVDDLEKVPSGQVVLLHGCCHNPTGVDPTQEQWRQLAELLARKELLPMFDIAYQGFGKGVAEDVQGLHTVAAAVKELLVCNSFSKNFGLYSERVGGLTLVSETAEIAQATFSQAKLAVRANYSNPPRHGGEIVVTILSDPQLKDEWLSELATMRERIQKMRTLIVETMKKYSDQDFSFIEQQLGMFSFTGLSPQQVERLQKEHGVYIVGSGRINVAGVTPANVESLCQAIGQVL